MHSASPPAHIPSPRTSAPTPQGWRRCLPLLASPKRSFKVLTSAQEKKEHLRANKNKPCQPRALCFPKMVTVHVWKGKALPAPLQVLCSHGPGLEAGNPGLTGAYGFTCSPHPVTLTAHAAFPLQTVLGLCEGHAADGARQHGGQALFMETWNITLSLILQPQSSVLIYLSSEYSQDHTRNLEVSCVAILTADLSESPLGKGI